ncbi:MAG: replication protein A [Archaeoglobales archaeon]|nr:MAG: replication protein A [Archaeoglobales archaeon]
MDKIAELTEQIVKRFKDSGFDVDPKEVSKRLNLLIHEFKVPESEAVRTVTNYLMKELEISREQLVAESPLVKVSDITSPGRWVSLKAKVVQLWDATSPNVSQVGLIGDETGIIKFVIWTKAGKGEVEEGKSYLFRNVVTDSFAGRMQVNINRSSQIVEIDEDIQLPPRELEVVGALVAIQQNSGLIRRCKLCNRTMTKEVCPVHGKTEGYDDLRIKGVIDDGENFYEVILNEDNIRELTGIGLKEARKMAEERLDRNAVLTELKNSLLGRYFRVVGTRGERYLIVREVEFLKQDIRELAGELL